MPTVRLESGVCSHDNLLLVTGGIVDHVKNRIAKSVDVYNFSTKHWSTSTPEALELPKAIQSQQLVVFEGYIYLMAGATVHPAQPETGNSEAWRTKWSDVVEIVEQPSKALKIVWTPITAPPPFSACRHCCSQKTPLMRRWCR